MTQNNDRFLITGATGNTGKTTVQLLLERGHRVRAFVHREDDRSRQLAATGAEIVVGDLLDCAIMRWRSTNVFLRSKT